MKKVRITSKTRITITGIVGFLEKTVTKFGTGAKVDCPKEYLGKKVYLVVRKDE
ncbi:transposon-encoded protein [mine drainage metagenome]|uniref:Transposon-encoded protein n=1 Tax=mine drainage metagenome TaxID=410659 RepID=T0ZE01_9ZZZZ